MLYKIRARFLSLAQSKLKLCSANHRAGYFSNLACDWLSIVWAYSEQETENGPWSCELTHYHEIHVSTYNFHMDASLPLVRSYNDDVIKWKHFPRYWPFVRGIHRSPVNSPHKGQWRGALMFSLICAWINSWANIHKADDLRRHPAHHDILVMIILVAFN